MLKCAFVQGLSASALVCALFLMIACDATQGKQDCMLDCQLDYSIKYEYCSQMTDATFSAYCKLDVYDDLKYCTDMCKKSSGN